MTRLAEKWGQTLVLSAAKPETDQEFRKSYSQMLDGLTSLNLEVELDPVLRNDQKLKFILRGLRDDVRQLARYLDRTYIWD